MQHLTLSVGMIITALIQATTSYAVTCSPDSVAVGATCVDLYEASVWEIPAIPENQTLRTQVQQGQVTLADLTSPTAVANGVIQRGISFDYPCSVSGDDCKDKIFAVSVAGAVPSALITWFQAQQACGNSGKRLLRNEEWQQAAAGTPDPGTDDGSTDCNVSSVFTAVPAGSRVSCVSAWGVFDMVGNMWEWVADWVPYGTRCIPPLFGGTLDLNCLSNFTDFNSPAAPIRGGDFLLGPYGGVFAVYGGLRPSVADVNVGFRCGR